MGARILIVDDNVELATFNRLELEGEGYEVDLAHDGQNGLMKFRLNPPDLVVLDWEMPGMDGVEVCARMRKSSHVPILMLTAKSGVSDRVAGLDAGANDYLTKPFHLEELLARIRALLRSSRPQELEELFYEDVALNLQTHEAWRDQVKLDLSPKEFELLKSFLLSPGRVLTKSQLFEQVWGWSSDSQDNAVEVYVHSLRGKLEQGGKPRLIQTRRGVGYLLKAEP
ncbi:MAG TPA: response regulator transcription factor [Candidatus Obscuribacterales bacterium]